MAFGWTRRDFLKTTLGACASGAVLEEMAVSNVAGQTSDITSLSLVEAGELLRTRKISPVDLTRSEEPSCRERV